MNPHAEFDIHGLAGIRLLDATAEDAAIVARQVGPLRSRLEREPEITIRFVDRLETSSRVRYVGVDDAGFTDDAFLVLRGKHKTRVRAMVPMDRVGRHCEIVCERRILQVPLLIPIVNLTVLGNGALPLHASAFTYRDRGMLATGWSKGGKTEALLACMAEGASYVGDEWVYLTGDGGRMYGIPEPIRVWSWHLASLPAYRRVVGIATRARLRALELTAGVLGRFSGETAARLKALLGGQRHVDVPPERLFGAGACAFEGVPETVLFIASCESDEIAIRRIDPLEVVDRMVASLQEEQATLISYYRKFRFAFPGAANELLERSEELQRDLLKGALDGKEAYEVLHPYPVSLPELRRAIDEQCVSR